MIDSLMTQIMQFLNSLEIKDTEHKKVRVGPKFDGGYVLLEKFLLEDKNLISIGIGNDVAFDLEFRKANNHAKIYLFDNTSSIKIKQKNFFFSKNNIGIVTNKKEKIIGINDLLKKFNESITLKMDIEGNEWSVLEVLDKKFFELISQMVIEFHIIHIDIVEKFLAKKYSPYFTKFYINNYKLINQSLFEKYYRVINKLKEYFYITHIHPNNSIKKIKIGQYSIPPLLEISFVNKKLVSNVEKTKNRYPMKNLDFQNKLDREDIKNFYPFIKK